jgi:hypothetical protein
MNSNVLEIRNYLLKPTMREHFIDNFEEHFIVAQQEVNMHVLGQFRVIGEPDHFVFLRGFADMGTRLEGLRNFYSGSAWEKWGPLANEMMLEWHNVHLLRPLSDIADLTCGLNADVMAFDFAAGTISPHTGMIVVDFYEALPGKRDALIDQFQTQTVPAYANEAIQLRGLFVAEMSENEFTRLPVIQNEDELVVITAYESEAAYREKCAKLTPHVQKAIGTLVSTTPETLLLNPTLRSPLRYLHNEQP